MHQNASSKMESEALACKFLIKKLILETVIVVVTDQDVSWDATTVNY